MKINKELKKGCTVKIITGKYKNMKVQIIRNIPKTRKIIVDIVKASSKKKNNYVKLDISNVSINALHK